MLLRSSTLSLVVAGLLFAAGSIQAAPKGSDSVVKATAAGKQVGDKQVINLSLTIDDKYHLYANPVGNDTFVESQVEVTAKVNGKPVDAKVEYPAGISVDGGEGVGKYREYRGTVKIKVTVDRAKIGTSPVELKVHVSACDATTCLFPADIKLSVPTNP